MDSRQICLLVPPPAISYQWHMRLVPPILSLLLVAGCAHPADAPVANLRFVPAAFDSFRRNAELHFTLAASAVVTIRITAHTAAGERTVKTIAEGARATKGSHAAAWLGDTDERFFAPAGIYYGVVETGGASYETNVQVFHF